MNENDTIETSTQAIHIDTVKAPANEVKTPANEAEAPTVTDTLSQDTVRLQTETHTDTIEIPCCYRMGFFQSSPYLHEEIDTRPSFRAERHQYSIRRDGTVGTITLTCLVTLVIILRKTRNFTRFQASEFPYAPHTRSKIIDLSSQISQPAILAITIILSTICSIAYYYHQTPALSSHALTHPHHTILAAYWVSILIYFIAKRLLSKFINWIFFDKIKRQLWQQSHGFVLLVQSSILLTYILIAINTPITPDQLIIYAIGILTIAKFVLFFKFRMIFFQKNYGILHLISYLCALEVMPMLILWQLLATITQHATVQI